MNAVVLAAVRDLKEHERRLAAAKRASDAAEAAADEFDRQSLQAQKDNWPKQRELWERKHAAGRHEASCDAQLRGARCRLRAAIAANMDSLWPGLTEWQAEFAIAALLD